MLQGSTTPDKDNALKRTAAQAVWLGMAAAGGVLVVRSLGGALTAQVPAVAVCFASTMAAAVCLTARWMYATSFAHQLDNTRRIAGCLATLVPPLAIGLILMPTHSIAGMSYLIGLLLLTGSMSLPTAGLSRPGWKMFRNRDVHRIQSRTMLTTPPVAAIGIKSGALSSGAGAGRSDSMPPPSTIQNESGASQWITRTLLPEGGECVEGTVKLLFSSGQKRTNFHLPFVPPLSHRPNLECEVLNGGPAKLRVAVAKPYGARIDVQRTGSIASAVTIEISFRAVASAVKADAA